MRSLMFFCGLLITSLASTTVTAIQHWETFTNTNEINALAIRGGTVWCGTDGGLVQRDTDGVVQRTFTVLDGLPDNRVSDLAFDSTGNLWAGFTGSGVIRYDGVAWSLFEECGGKTIRGVNTITSGHEGTVWFGAAEGIFRYESEQWTFYAFKRAKILALEAISDHIAWVGTDRGLYRFDGVEWEFIPVGDRADTVYVRALAIDSHGVLWVGADQGLFSRDGENWTTNPVPPIENLTIDSTGTVLAGSYNSLYFKDRAEWRFASPNMGGISDAIRALASDSNGKIWIGGDRGLSCYYREKWTRYVTPGPLTNNPTALALGPDGAIWVGAWKGNGSSDGGVFRYHDGNWTSFLEDGYVHCLAVGNDGEVWASGLNGVFRYDGLAWKKFSQKDGMSHSNVTHIDIGPDGRVWAATLLGLDIYDGKSWTNFRKSTVQFVIFTKSGEIWIAYSSDGIGYYNGSEWIGYNQIGEFPQTISTAMAVAPDDATWIAANGGVCRVKGGKWTTYPLPNDYITRQIYTIASMVFDRDGVLWCIIEGGLYYFENGSWSAYAGPDWLKRVPLTSITISPDGAFWMRSRNEGIYRLILSTSTHIEDEHGAPLPGCVITGNHPNPFNPATTITFSLPSPGRATLAVYSITGQRVRTLLSGSLSDGSIRSYGTDTMIPGGPFLPACISRGWNRAATRSQVGCS